MPLSVVAMEGDRVAVANGKVRDTLAINGRTARLNGLPSHPGGVSRLSDTKESLLEGH